MKEYTGTMISIPAGSFQMGYDYVHNSKISDKINVYYPEEQPVHRVTLSAFKISSTVMTQGQYRAIIGENPSTFTGDDNLPVTNLGASKALEFCNMLSEAERLEPSCDEKTGKCNFTRNGYRLSTEAEWEYACRAVTKGHFYTGNTESDLARAGWYIGNSGGKTHPVAQKEPNAWGLYDMHGNVWEFCYDATIPGIHRGIYSSKSVTDPKDSGDFNYRITRGGGWFSDACDCRSATRGRFWTGGGNYYTGFRIAQSVV